MPALVLINSLSNPPITSLSNPPIPKSLTENAHYVSPAQFFFKVGLNSKYARLLRFSHGQYGRIPGCPKNSMGIKTSSGNGDTVTDEWIQKLPENKKALYSHSLPCIEAWLRSLGFYQSKEDRAVWHIEKPEWHAQLSLDITDLYIRYLKSGPGNLERDIERKFSYALSREDLENAILGGP